MVCAPPLRAYESAKSWGNSLVDIAPGVDLPLSSISSTSPEFEFGVGSVEASRFVVAVDPLTRPRFAMHPSSSSPYGILVPPLVVVLI